MSSISSNHIELPNPFRLDEVDNFINIESTTRGAQDCPSFVMNIFDTFGSKENGRCLRRSNQLLNVEDTCCLKEMVCASKQETYLGIIKALKAPNNSIHISFDSIQMIECSRNLTNYIIQSRT